LIQNRVHVEGVYIEGVYGHVCVHSEDEYGLPRIETYRYGGCIPFIGKNRDVGKMVRVPFSEIEAGHIRYQEAKRLEALQIQKEIDEIKAGLRPAPKLSVSAATERERLTNRLEKVRKKVSECNEYIERMEQKRQRAAISRELSDWPTHDENEQETLCKIDAELYGDEEQELLARLDQLTDNDVSATAEFDEAAPDSYKIVEVDRQFTFVFS